MLSEINELLETAVDILNEGYFNNELPRCTITIQSSVKSYGYITVKKIWLSEGESYHEINISAEYLSRPYYEIFATLLHEMVHLYCMVQNIADTSQNGRYHNGRFKAEAEKRDLLIEHVPHIGWTKTTATEQYKQFLIAHGLDVKFSLFRGTGSKPGADKTPPHKTSTRKYKCPQCGISVRATKDVNLICGDCLSQMVKV